MRKFEIVSDEVLVRSYIEKDKVKLPTRADKGSAGYDFYSPCEFTLSANGGFISLPMGIKVAMEEDEVLMLYVRSSIGIKKKVVLSNGTGVIDSTYYNNPSNEGEIYCALTNMSDEDQHFNAGDRIMQGIFIKYLTTDDDKPLNDNRVGGIGSSGR